MTNRSVLLFGLVTIFGWVSPASARERCPPNDEIGWISAIEMQSVGRPTALPVVNGSGGKSDAAEGMALCNRDVIENPAGSRRVVRARLAGGFRKTILPGEAWQIPKPDWLAVKLEALNRWLSSTVPGTPTAADAPDVSRGAGCAYAPFEPEVRSYAVKEWGPLQIAWPCKGDAETVWTARLTSPGTQLNVEEMVSSNFVQVNISDCQDSCMVSVHDMTANKMVYAQIIIIVTSAQAKLPASISRMAPGAVRDALAGAVLSRRPEGKGWRLQGHSLLYGAGCDVPAARRLAHLAYGFPTPDEPCLRGDHGEPE
jgi:hypothetical protein